MSCYLGKRDSVAEGKSQETPGQRIQIQSQIPVQSQSKHHNPIPSEGVSASLTESLGISAEGPNICWNHIPRASWGPGSGGSPNAMVLGCYGPTATKNWGHTRLC